MEKYVLEALCLMGFPSIAQERIKRRYAKMVEHPEYTTLWEGWGIGREGFGGGTINHAWSGGPLTILSQYFAGIFPTTPAFATYRIYPLLGRLKEIDCRVQTQFGAIQTSIRRGEHSFFIKLDSPPKTVATVGLPAGQGEEIVNVRLNGRIIWNNGKTGARLHGVRCLEFSEDGRLCFEVPGGEWSFEAEIAPRKQSQNP
jgi:hypothetical protein